ncbi:hypothetical protein GUITHDRAFT_148304 [Guillardia theta CCMP2712]|uniref:PDZ domain-containing protein n=1 Tax=Guillardia theta (strain CCMP2712) TaxID=905079 RepID=L1I9X6_GUITC|nr:hypothetical protein GUITHDRAFT_148304 [Guillardia theta CCMP2712]EKX32887.1 hypothetical protein GUITHDRAFT_148304 [Guillardia theta CCMP2712]|eukprot:XP_005819867.1 hypothetical protein GUITHDRAFT_148304 [Guillardia theta CCMP2712]
MTDERMGGQCRRSDGEAVRHLTEPEYGTSRAAAAPLRLSGAAAGWQHYECVHEEQSLCGRSRLYSIVLDPIKQAGVGLLLGEQEESKVVTVKQVVPRGSADRAGKVKVGDQAAWTGVGVTEMRHLIIGEQGSAVRVTFRNPSSGEVYDLDLIRGTPDYFDALQGGGSSQAPPAGVSLYASGNRIPTLNRYMLGTSWSAEMFANVVEETMPPPQPVQVDQTPQRALQEENEWLRSALRMAESTIMRNRQELSRQPSMREQYDKNEVDQDARIKEIENINREKDDEKREVEQQMLQAERYRRSLEARLAEAQRRTEWQRESEHQIQIKRRAEEEKRYLEMELMRAQVSSPKAQLALS